MTNRELQVLKQIEKDERSVAESLARGDRWGGQRAMKTATPVSVIYSIPDAMKGDPAFLQLAALLQSRLDAMPPDKAIAFLESNRYLLEFPDLREPKPATGCRTVHSRHGPASR